MTAKSSLAGNDKAPAQLERRSSSQDRRAPSAQAPLADQTGDGASDARTISLRLPDTASIAHAFVGGLAFFALALFSLDVMRFENQLASVWLPNAFAVAYLLRAQLRSEGPFIMVAFFASIAANTAAGNPIIAALPYSIANMADIIIVTWATRRLCSAQPDMTDLNVLARFVWSGGLAGPLISAWIAAGLIGALNGADLASTAQFALSWFLTDSMGMILVVPALLLVCSGLQARGDVAKRHAAGSFGLLAMGAACTYLVFDQNAFPLLFLIPPITLLHAFILGSLGTALFVAIIAGIAAGMTWAGHGPIFAASPSAVTQSQLIQAFLAANFLTGLPVSAILAGRDRMTRELARGKRRIDLITQNINDAVLHFDAQGLSIYASPSARSVLGIDPDTFIAEPIAAVACSKDKARVNEAAAALLEGTSEKERFTFCLANSGEGEDQRYIEADCAAVIDPDTGNRTGIVAAARDVSERTALERELTQARCKAEDAARAKSEFLANMSHEIRTPMNGVLGFAELILQDDLSDEHRRHIEMIVKSGRSMMLLLNDVLDLSRIEAGEIATGSEPVDLQATLEECVALHQPSAIKKDIALDLEYQRGSPGEEDFTEKTGAKTPWILSDGLRLRQIVLNLLGNAVKFTASGSIRLRYRLEAEELILTVEDTGIGIDENQLEQIFLPFAQASSDVARNYGGTGLGLAISRRLVQALGGRLDVASTKDSGSCFTLRIPASPIKPEAAPEPASPAPNPASTLPPARILLVEDHDVNRELIAAMLDRCGQSVEVAHDGNEAISMVMDGALRARPFDLVLMDVQMPDCDGLTATKAIRGEGIGARALPIIALTANAFPEDIAATKKAGMQAHLAKPVDFDELVAALDRWLPVRIIDAPMDRDILADSGDEIDGLSPVPSITPEDAPSPRARSNALSQGSQSQGGPTWSQHNDLPPAASHSPDTVPAEAKPSGELRKRWLDRRTATLRAVREAIASEVLGNRAESEEMRDQLARLLHKLAGTAAIFDEPELGDHAAALERAIRLNLGYTVQEALAYELIAHANAQEQA